MRRLLRARGRSHLDRNARRAVCSGAGAKPDFSTQSELVVLHVAVKDRKGGYVGGLGQDSFRVLEDRRPQDDQLFQQPGCAGHGRALIDASGSMAPNRDMVIAASMAFSKAMNPQDEFFVMGFNEHIHTPLPADKPFTNSEPALRVALVQAIKARGQTAIYNAVNAGLDYVQKGGFERQVLIVLSDGGDNASATTRAQVLANAQASNAVIYTIALVDPMDSEADPGFLRQLSESTGGVAFRPKNAADIEDILQQVARDIRNMYTHRIRPVETRPQPRARRTLRRVAVDVRLPTGQKLAVRTRRAYLAGEDERRRTMSGNAPRRWRGLGEPRADCRRRRVPHFLQRRHGSHLALSARCEVAGRADDFDRAAGGGRDTRAGRRRSRSQTGEIIGRVDIPRLKLSAAVAEGDDDKTLGKAVGHLPDTPLPWHRRGNVALAAHRDGLFRLSRRYASMTTFALSRRAASSTTA